MSIKDRFVNLEALTTYLFATFVLETYLKILQKAK